MEDLTEEVRKLYKEVEELKSVVIVSSRLLPGTFFRQWYVAFLIVFVVMAVAMCITAIHLPLITADVDFIAQVLEGSEVIIE